MVKLFTFPNFFLLTSFLLIIVFLFFNRKKRSSTRRLRKSYNYNLWGFVLLLCYIISLLTLQNYFFPSNPRIMKNTDYHMLEHRGYQYDDSLYLVNGINPELAIWDKYYGEAFLKNEDTSCYLLNLKEFYNPLYIKNVEEGEKYYFLRNTKNAFKIKSSFALANDNDSIVFLIDDSKGKDTTSYAILKDGRKYYSTFHRTLYSGFPIEDIAVKIPELHSDINIWMDLINGCLLVRDKVSSPLLKNDIQYKEIGELYFFPSRQ